MNELPPLEQLLSAARQETPPPVDVTERVLATVQQSQVRLASSSDRTVMVFAAVSAVAASIVAVIAWQLLEQPLVDEVLNPLVLPLVASQ